MEQRVLTTDEEFEALRPDWNALHEDGRGTPYQAFDWLFSWWKVYRDLVRMRLLVLRDRDRLCGVVPLFIETKKVAGFSLRRLRMMGELEISGSYEPLCLDHCTNDVAGASAELITQLLKNREVDVADFHHFSSDSPVFKKLADEAKKKELLVRTESRSVVRLVLRPASDWRAYALTLSRHDRQLRSKYERKLFSSGVELEKIDGCDNEAMFQDFVQLHSRAMAARSVAGHFASKAHYGEFLKVISSTSSPTVQPRWFFLKKDGERFAAILAFYSHKYCSIYLTGRNPDHELARYSPGIVLMNMVIRDAIEGGYTTIDLGEGGTPYKFTLGAEDEGFGRLTIARRHISPFTIMPYFILLAFHRSALWKNYVEPTVQRWRNSQSTRKG
ncbi:MAG TPA: GNAT family N-acetyltransferase [Bacteroidota bacterium]|nr:GNAT family N-acetyltransferase [Bacteroidota bacterium]